MGIYHDYLKRLTFHNIKIIPVFLKKNKYRTPFSRPGEFVFFSLKKYAGTGMIL